MAHYKRSMKKGNICVGDYIYHVIRRASRFYPIRTKLAIKYIRRLSRKYSTTPGPTARRLVEQMFGFGPIGMNNGKICYNEFDFAFQPHRVGAMCMLSQKTECSICGKPILIYDRNDDGESYCPTEWCARLYEFYYVQGNKRPNLAKYGIRLSNVDGDSRFNFFLTDFIKRTANEQTKSQHRRTS